VDRRIKRVASTQLAGRIHVRNLELTEMRDQLLLALAMSGLSASPSVSVA